jgi:8-oxo-dGTP pyrophosphatase MutT (NUDIX family)
VTGPPRSLDALAASLASRAPVHVEVPAGAIEAAVAAVLTPGPGGLELLLIRRAEKRGDPWSGHMALPGGRRDQGDHDLFATARRETLEETAIELPEATLLGQLDDLNPTTTTLPSIVVRPFVFGVEARPPIRPNHEVAAHLWTPLAELHAARIDSEVLHHGARRMVPSYRIGEHVVWGMTHRILDPLVRLGR